MPQVAAEISESYKSILRPVVFDVTRSMLKMTGLDPDTKIVYPGDNSTLPQPGSTLTDREENKSDVSFGSEARVTIEATEEYNDPSMLTTAVLQKENIAFFADQKLGVYLKPVYAKSDITLTVTYRAASKTEAERWRNDMRRKVAMGRKEVLHEIQYHYPVPKELLVILYGIHFYRENVAGYGETLKTYFMNHFAPKVTTLTNLAGNQPLLAITEKQIGIVGYFDFESMPEAPERDSDMGPWTVSFDYRFSFDKVISCAMRYPLMVHNQILPPNLRSDEPLYRLGEQIQAPSWSRHLFDRHTFKQPRPGHAIDGISIPYYDDWMPNNVVPYTSSLLKILMSVDELDPTLILNLKELGYYEIDPDIVTYMEDVYQDLATPFESIISLSLYRNDRIVETDTLTVEPDLTVRSANDMSLREPQHFRIGLLHDLSTLSERGKEKLREHGAACIKMMLVLEPRLQELGMLPKLVGGKYVAKKDLKAFIDYYNKKRTLHRGKEMYRWMAVGFFTITTERGLSNANS